MLCVNWNKWWPIWGSSFLWQRAGRSEGNDVLLKEAHTGQMWPEIQASCARTTVQWPRYRLVQSTVAIIRPWYHISSLLNILRQDEEAFYAPQRVHFWHQVSESLTLITIFLYWFHSCWFFCFNFQCCCVSCWLATEPKAFEVPQHHSSRAGRCVQ